MTALSQARTIEKRDGTSITLTTKTGVTIYKGALVMLDRDKAIPAKTATSKIVLGIAENTAKAGETVTITKGVYGFVNSASSDQIGLTEIGSDCYAVDDQTVAKTNGSSTRSKAGTVIDVREGYVWVKIA